MLPGLKLIENPLRLAGGVNPGHVPDYLRRGAIVRQPNDHVGVGSVDRQPEGPRHATVAEPVLTDLTPVNPVVGFPHPLGVAEERLRDGLT